MKRPTLFLLFITFSVFLFSQSNPVTLDTVCASLSANANTTGDFTQTKTILTNGRKLKSSGQYIICPQGILWKTEKPLPSSLILTKDTMVQISANGKKSVMSGKDNQTFSSISETLSSVFSGNVEALRKNFICDFNMTSAGNWALNLQPKDSTISAVMKTLLLSGTISEKGKAELKSLIMTEASDNTITYDFTNQQYPEELSADEKQIFVIE